MHYVFSYGTLLDKYPKNAKPARLHACLEMDSYGMFPALVKSKEPNTFVGYVLELSDTQFANADHYEGYPNLYTRKEYNVELDDQTIKAWVYILA